MSSGPRMTWLGLFGYSRSIPDRASCAIAAACASDNRDPKSGGAGLGCVRLDGAGGGEPPEGRAGDAGKDPAASARDVVMQKRRRLAAVGVRSVEVCSRGKLGAGKLVCGIGCRWMRGLEFMARKTVVKDCVIDAVCRPGEDDAAGTVYRESCSRRASSRRAKEFFPRIATSDNVSYVRFELQESLVFCRVLEKAGSAKARIWTERKATRFRRRGRHQLGRLSLLRLPPPALACTSSQTYNE